MASITSTIPTWLLMFMVMALIFITFQLLVQKTRKQVALPPGPIGWPIIGSLLNMKLSNKPTFRWLHQIMDEFDTEISCIRMGNVHVILVSCPTIALEIKRKHDAVFASRPRTMATKSITNGYLGTALSPFGHQWQKMRRILASELFSSEKHIWLHDKRMEEANNLIFHVFHRYCTNNLIVNVRNIIQQHCLHVIRKLILGKGMPDGGPGFEEDEHIRALFTVLRHAFSFCVSDYFPCLLGLDLDGHEKIIKENCRILDKYQDPIINDRIRQRRQNNIDSNKQHEDLLDILVTLKDPDGSWSLTPQEIKGQVKELMTSIDNPSSAVEWALAEMLNEPKLLEKAVKELDRVVGKERLVQESDIPNLNYLKACLRESFRLHPGIPFNPPCLAMTDTVVSGYFIPKGSHILLSKLGLGRNPKVWDNPLKFIPERHLIKNNVDGSCFHEVFLTEPELRFISFSTGRRGCVAPTLGIAITVMLFARLLQCFTWTAPDRNVSLDESENNLFMANPLISHANPRLHSHLYTQRY